MIFGPRFEDLWGHFGRLFGQHGAPEGVWDQSGPPSLKKTSKLLEKPSHFGTQNEQNLAKMAAISARSVSKTVFGRYNFFHGFLVVFL